MKIRNDFVTNSSSSSFIIAFNNNNKFKSYDDFVVKCEMLDYTDFKKLIETLQECDENTDKQKALDFLHRYYRYRYKQDLLDKKIKREDYDGITEYFIAASQIENSEGFKKEIEQYILNDVEYLEKKKEIEEADRVVMGTIWDTNGGVLEWSIRNGFIEDNFSNNHVITWNVG